MAMQLYLKKGSATTDFQSGTDKCTLVDGFNPAVGQVGEEVTEEFEIWMYHDTNTSRVDFIREVNALFQDARHWEIGREPVWLYFAIDEVTTAYRAQVLDGLITFTPKLGTHWKNARTKAVVRIQREAAWEADTWTAIGISNGNGSGVTTGLHVYNCNDGTGTSPNKKNNYATITGTDILGDLPGPAKLQITPADSLNRIIVGNYVDVDAVGNYPVDLVDFSGTADSNSSGGQYLRKTIAAGFESAWSTSLAHAYFQSNWIRIYARFSNAVPDGFRLKVGFQVGSILMGETNENWLTTDRLQCLGMVKFPPYKKFSSPPTNFILYHTLYSRDGGNLDMDCYYLIGANYFADLGRDDAYTIGSGSRFVEEWGSERRSYAETTGGADQQRFFNFDYGEGIYLEPGKNQKLQFMSMNGIQASIDDDFTVKLWHKPRRLSL